MIEKGFIYLATNRLNKKRYVGQCIGTLKSRRKKHYDAAFKYNSPLRFHCALRKYGKSTFYWRIIEAEIDLNHLDDKETYYIKHYDSFYHGYNMTLGGKTMNGYKHTEETKKKISEKTKGISNLDRYVNRYGEVEGKKIYEEYVDKMRWKKGKSRLSLFIEKHGEEEGKKRYERFIESIKIERKRVGATNTLESYIKRYGEEGRKKYEIFSNKLKKKNSDETKKKKSEAKKLYWQNKKRGK